MVSCATDCNSTAFYVPAASMVGLNYRPRIEMVIPLAATNWKAQIVAEMVEEMNACRSVNWVGDGAMPLSAEAYDLALAFLDALPHSLPKPRLVAEPDGCFAFEWSPKEWRSLIVSISPDYRLHYAALLDRTTRKTAHGEESFFGHIPSSVSKILIELYNA